MLRGVGTAMALPLLDAMHVASAAAAAGKTPVRAAWIFVPNGAHMQAWTPKEKGKGYKLPPILQPLQSLKGDFNVLSGLGHRRAAANGDGAGDHARSAGTFLNGMQCKKTAGKDIRAGISVDQVAAKAIGSETMLGSLEIGIDGSRMAGNCDSGYSCAYSSNISWRGESTPNAKETNPYAVFQRMFADRKQPLRKVAVGQAKSYRQSVLDLVQEDAKGLRGDLGTADQKKLDEYLDSVRELEKRIELAGKKAASGQKTDPDAKLAVKNWAVKFEALKKQGKVNKRGTPGDYAEHVRLMSDLMVLGFRTDTTRLSTFMFTNAGSGRKYTSIGIKDGHHDLSHHERKPEKQAQIQKINTYHVELYAYLLSQMKAVQEGDRTLLDNSMIMYGSGCGDGNRHNHNDLPVLLAGKGGGTIKTGYHVQYERNTPLCGLYVSMLHRLGVKAATFGDAKKAIKLA
jgi:hypothetical protein